MTGLTPEQQGVTNKMANMRKNNMNRTIGRTLLGVLALPFFVACVTVPPSNTSQLRGAPLTDAWMNVQVDGTQASAEPQFATAAEKELANQRLLDSYEHPIPEYMPRSPGGSTAQ